MSDGNDTLYLVRDTLGAITNEFKEQYERMKEVYDRFVKALEENEVESDIGGSKRDESVGGSI